MRRLCLLAILAAAIAFGQAGTNNPGSGSGGGSGIGFTFGTSTPGSCTEGTSPPIYNTTTHAPLYCGSSNMYVAWTGSTAWASLTGVPSVNGHSLTSNVTVTPTDLSLLIGTNTQAWSANLDAWSALATSSKVGTATTVNGHPLSSNVTVTPTDLSLLIGTNTEAWSANLDAWSALSTSSLFTWPATTSQDLVIGGTAGAATRFPKGSDGQRLKMASGLITWASESIPTIPSVTNILLGDGAGNASDSAVALASVLLSSGSYSAPSWLTSISATILTGTVAAARLPNPTASTLGGVQSLAASTNQWINTISTSGVPSSTQPAFSNLSGTATAAQGGEGLRTGVPMWLRFWGDSSETFGTQCASGCNITGEHWFDSFNLPAGQTLTVNVANQPLVIRSPGTCTIAGTVNASGSAGGITGAATSGDWGGSGGGGGFGAANGTVGGTDTTNNWTIAIGGTVGTSGVAGGNGNTVSGIAKQHSGISANAFPKGGAPGGAGGSSGGAGGAAGGSVVFACNTINFTGTINANGANGGAGGSNTGGGGGGGAGYVWLAALTLTNSGTITVTGGTGGAAGTGTSTAGGSGGNGWSFAGTIQ